MSTCSCYKISLLAVCIFLFTEVFSQMPFIKEENEVFKTYPYSDPNPVPVLGVNKKVAPFYPYFDYDGYTDKSKIGRAHV